jgi:hypothetical protein
MQKARQPEKRANYAGIYKINTVGHGFQIMSHQTSLYN